MLGFTPLASVPLGVAAPDAVAQTFSQQLVLTEYSVAVSTDQNVPVLASQSLAFTEHAVSLITDVNAAPSVSTE